MDRVKILATAELNSRAYAAELLPNLAGMLGQVEAPIHRVQAIVVVNGPGSFTGIRVGLSAAKGLAQPRSIPIVSVSRLALLAGASGLPHVLAVVEAGRGEYYAGEYSSGMNLGERLLSAVDLIELAQRPSAGILVVEEPANSFSGGLTQAQHDCLAPCHPVYLRSPNAADLLLCALERVRSRDFADLERLDGNYLRRSDAEASRSVTMPGTAKAV
jgi:tRNA threonylcarbamoyladenosine biosynthesis protein TsaB